MSDDDIKIKVALKNYNDKRPEKLYTARLEKLKNTERLYRSNFKNEIQDLPVLSKEEFIRKFPYDRYEKEENKVEKILLERQELATKNENYYINLNRLSSGKYRLVLYNVEGRDTIKAEQYFEVWDTKGLSKGAKTFLEGL